MYYFIPALKDATIYLQQPTQNTGLDEVLEVSKTYYGVLTDVAHSLIKFDTDILSDLITEGAVTMSVAELIMKECESSEIPAEFTLYAHPISQSWDMGIGTRFDDISTSNVTWNYRQTGIDWLVGEYSLGTDGTLTGTGGTWYTGSASTQSFEYLSKDLEMDIIDPMNSWLDGDIPNEGFLLKYSQEFENNTTDYGTLQFFGKETNTIYQPKVRIGWDDSTFATGSLTELTSDDISVSFKRLKTAYKVGSTPRIKVIGRENYPLKTYTSQYGYTDIKYLPVTTYYQIKDIITDEILIPFSDYAKISCDDTGNYFNLNLTNWETNREYYIEIKIIRNGVIEYFSDDVYSFTVEAN